MRQVWVSWGEGGGDYLPPSPSACRVQLREALSSPSSQSEVVATKQQNQSSVFLFFFFLFRFEKQKKKSVCCRSDVKELLVVFACHAAVTDGR